MASLPELSPQKTFLAQIFMLLKLEVHSAAHKCNQAIKEVSLSHFSACKAMRAYIDIESNLSNSHDIYDKQLLKIKAGNQAKRMFWKAISIALS